MTTKRTTFLMMLSLITIILMGSVSPKITAVAAQSVTVPAPTITVPAQAGLAYQVKTGQILAAHHSDKALPIASLTKVLALYVILDQIKEKKLSWHQRLTPSAAMVAFSQNKAYSNIPLTSAQSYTVQELYQASWLVSANDAVMMLGQAAAGSAQQFIKLMRAKLTQLQLKGTIESISGLDNALIPETLRAEHTAAQGVNRLSAKALGVIVAHLLQDYPTVLATTRLKSFTFAGQTYQNIDQLVQQRQSTSTRQVIGLKTGTSDLAGQCLISVVDTPELGRVVAILLHTNHSQTNTTARYQAMTSFLNQLLAKWHNDTVLTRQQLVKTVAVASGQHQQVQAVAARNFKWPVPVGQTLQPRVTWNAVPVAAPVIYHQVLGKLSFPKIGLGQLTAQTPTVQIVAKNAVARLTWWEAISRWFQQLVSSVRSWFKSVIIKFNL